jgi:hypothetical protein
MHFRPRMKFSLHVFTTGMVTAKSGPLVGDRNRQSLSKINDPLIEDRNGRLELPGAAGEHRIWFGDVRTLAMTSEQCGGWKASKQKTTYERPWQRVIDDGGPGASRQIVDLQASGFNVIQRVIVHTPTRGPLS